MRIHGTITGKDLSHAELEQPVLGIASKVRPAFAWAGLLLLSLMLVTLIIMSWITTLFLAFMFWAYTAFFMPWQYNRALSRQGLLAQEYTIEISEAGLAVHTGPESHEIARSNIRSWHEGLWQVYLNLEDRQNAITFPKRWLDKADIERLRSVLAEMEAAKILSTDS